MIPKQCKRLAEVDFPIAEVSKHAARGKSGPKGHPSMLHLWWARRPLASSRAVLMALLLPDPCDTHCPEEFKIQARRVLGEVRQAPTGDVELQRALLWFIGSFASWDMSSHPIYLKVARNLIRAAHPEETPLVVDPFSGGGSIPLEALRLACEAFATDLNPVACLILKVLLKSIPHHGPELAKKLRKVGDEINEAAGKQLGALYPADSDGSTPIAYLWARTVRCESPNCGTEIPLLRSLWLCKKKAVCGQALRIRAVRPKGQPPRVEFEIFQPSSDKEVAPGTVTRAKASCPCCGGVLPPERVRAQLSAQNGGADAVFDTEGNRTGGARISAVVTLRPGEKGRHFRLPTAGDYAAVCQAQGRVAEILAKWERSGKQGLCPVPDETLPLMSGTFNVPLYGVNTWGDLFTARQKVALITLGRIIALAVDTEEQAMSELLACALSRVAMSGMSCTRWNATAEKMQHTFGRQALPMVWDFAEVVPIAKAPGNWKSGYDIVAKIVEASPRSSKGIVQLADATDHPLPDQSAGVWFTDPPYYFAVPYADLSDFFFVWLKRILPGHPLLRDPFDPMNGLTPDLLTYPS